VRDVLPDLVRWWRDGDAAGLATVVSTWSSAPRPAGAAMAVGPDGTVTGSVSGGCVESVAYDLCREVAATGRSRIAHFGVGDDQALAAGLPCGGTIDLLVERVDRRRFPGLPALAGAVAAGRPATLLTRLDDARHLVIAGGSRIGSLGSERLDAALGARPAGQTAVLHEAGVAVFAAAFEPPARMIVFGATDHAAAVSRIGRFLGYRVAVCDARQVFATAHRFPDADEVVADWPHRYLAGEAAAGRLDGRTVLVVLTHDPKFDVPVLEVALRLPVAYVGAMGSRRTHRDRDRRLAETGLDEAARARLAAPLGLDLGARTPEETAVSIAAEIVALRRGGSGARLGALDGPIHPAS
jgi:xanthine dehydrogenase accessory factor